MIIDAMFLCAMAELNFRFELKATSNKIVFKNVQRTFANQLGAFLIFLFGKLYFHIFLLDSSCQLGFENLKFHVVLKYFIGKNTKSFFSLVIILVHEQKGNNSSKLNILVILLLKRKVKKEQEIKWH